jgi:hypothetical protein
MRELTDAELMVATEEEINFYNKCIEGLPSINGLNGDGLGENGEPLVYGSGPHIVKHFIETVKIVQPKRIFEIGFNLGYSAAIWMEVSEAEVCSCDISEREETIKAARFLEHKYRFHDRFTFNHRYDLDDENGGVNPFHEFYFDLAFIDGGHDTSSIIKDIVLCKKWRIPFLLFDDWYPRFADTQIAVAQFPELELVKDMNNLRLYKVNHGSNKV